MAPERTPEGKWVIYDAATGERMERWPVDARGLIADGSCLAHSPESPQEVPVFEAPTDPLRVEGDRVVGTHPTGAPPVVVQAHDATPAAPVELPVGRRPKGR